MTEQMPRDDAQTLDAVVAMTLAEIAYAEPEDIGAQLRYPSYSTRGEWRLDWVGESPGNLVYVAQNVFSKRRIIAVRGSVVDPFSEAFWVDWFVQDLEVATQVSVPVPGAPEDAAIAWGANEALHDVLHIHDVDQRNTLLEYICSVEAEWQSGDFAVVGHSLGGQIASVLSVYLSVTLQQTLTLPAEMFVPHTFAAPTAGDRVYAAWAEAHFAGAGRRYHNALDVVPHTWDVAGLDWIRDGFPEGPSLPLGLRWALDWMRHRLVEKDADYTQPGVGKALKGTLSNTRWWVEEAGHQHSGQTYVELLGGVPVCFPRPPRFAQHEGISRAALRYVMTQ